jgi:hypothetical protein
MANSSINVSSLDFDTLKDNFKEYLKTQSVFKDYNFDGSNISVLLDVMAYNSYLNSFYLNMVASEMFLDSAQKYESVVSHAKELNYVPRSAHSAVANISFTVTAVNLPSNKLTVPKGTKFYGTNSNGAFSFVTDTAVTYVSSNDTFDIVDLQINEGAYFQDSFVVDYDIENQRFLLSNQNIDTNQIEVTVFETPGSQGIVYKRATTLYNLDSNSEVFFIQGAENNKYEIVFGDSLFGKRPPNGSSVIISYIVTNGSDGNGVDNITLSDDLGDLNNGSVIVSDITVGTASVTGANVESIDSIRFSAPRYFATQQRAVSSDDYASLVKAAYGGEIDDVLITGGQDLEPKLYGRVAVSIKPSQSLIASDILKNKIVNYLNDFIALPNRVVIKDPEYFNIDISSTVQLNSKLTTKNMSEIKTNIVNGIVDFSTNNLEKFGNDFRYSKFVTTIDNIDTSIVSNDTHVKLVKKISPTYNFATSYDIYFNNVAEQEGIYDGVAYPDERVFTSSTFTYIDEDNVEWPNSYLEDNPAPTINGKPGDIEVYTFLNGKKTIINRSIGTIEYSTGYVKISNLKTSSYNDGNISLFLTTLNKDILANQNMILLIDASDIQVNVIEYLK